MSKSFNLEAFKNGKKALTRDGRVATFVGVCEKCPNNEKLIAHINWDDNITSYSLRGAYRSSKESDYDLVSMVSRHQALIDAYDPEDTWQFSIKTYDNWFDIEGKPEWEENREFRLPPHNDLIKALKSGKEIVATNTDGNEVPLDCLEDLLDPRKDWDDLRIKTEPEFEYPIYKEAIDNSGLVVKFLSLTQGEVVERGNTCYTVGQIHNYWYEHTKDSFWQDWTPIAKSKPTIHCLAYDAKRFDHEQTTEVQARVVKKEVAEANGWKIIQE